MNSWSAENYLMQQNMMGNASIQVPPTLPPDMSRMLSLGLQMQPQTGPQIPNFSVPPPSCRRPLLPSPDIPPNFMLAQKNIAPVPQHSKVTREPQWSAALPDIEQKNGTNQQESISQEKEKSTSPTQPESNGLADMVLEPITDSDMDNSDDEVEFVSESKKEPKKKDYKCKDKKSRGRLTRGPTRETLDREKRWERFRNGGRERSRSSDRPAIDRHIDRADRSRRSRGRSPETRRSPERKKEKRREKPEQKDKSKKTDSDRSRPTAPVLPMAGTGQVVMPGMVGYGNLGQIMAQVPSEMAINMPNMANMMTMMCPIVPGMSMMNPATSMQPVAPNQTIYIDKDKGMLRPPKPGIVLQPRREKPLGCRTIFVGGLPKGISETTITEVFQRFGTITEVKLLPRRVCHIRFEQHESVEKSFVLSGYRYQCDGQMETEATSLFIDYALNREDFFEYERKRRHFGATPPPVEPYSVTSLDNIFDKIRSEEHFLEAASTVCSWLQQGKCTKHNAHKFFKLIQAANSHVRRLHNEKMALDEEYQILKTTTKNKFGDIIEQFEQISNLLSAAHLQRAWDTFNKQQRTSIKMWDRINEEVELMKEEIQNTFKEDEDSEAENKITVSDEQHEESKIPLPRLPSPPTFGPPVKVVKPQPQAPPEQTTPTFSEARLISILTAFLISHPLGATFDYLISYVRSMIPDISRATVQQVLETFSDVFQSNSYAVGANVERRWRFVTFDNVKNDVSPVYD